MLWTLFRTLVSRRQRKKGNSTPTNSGLNAAAFFHWMVPIFLFVAAILVLFLNLSCVSSASGFSGVYLIHAPCAANSTDFDVRTGYFHACSIAANSTACSAVLKAPPGVARTFGDHIVKPYLMVIAEIVIVAALILWLAGLTTVRLGLTSLTMVILANFFTLLAATWQEVAVHAVITLVSEAKKGYRASGMVWASQSLLFAAFIIETFDYITGVTRSSTSSLPRQQDDSATFVEGQPYASSYDESFKSYNRC